LVAVDEQPGKSEELELLAVDFVALIVQETAVVFGTPLQRTIDPGSHRKLIIVG
jgi:hypothetical protein